jgi:hypothetical protein
MIGVDMEASITRRNCRFSSCFLLPIFLLSSLFLRPDMVAPSLQPAQEDQPIWLGFLTWLIGDDWLGADWMYLGIAPYSASPPRQSVQEDSAPNLSTSARFWTNPGPALLKPGDRLWVWGYEAAPYTVYADSILVNPQSGLAPPDDVSTFGDIIDVESLTIELLEPQGVRYTVIAESSTAFTFPPGVGQPRPQAGRWLNISWLTGSDGLLGQYSGFHGSYRGLLRFDFDRP